MLVLSCGERLRRTRIRPQMQRIPDLRISATLGGEPEVVLALV